MTDLSMSMALLARFRSRAVRSVPRCPPMVSRVEPRRQLLPKQSGGKEVIGKIRWRAYLVEMGLSKAV